MQARVHKRTASEWPNTPYLEREFAVQFLPLTVIFPLLVLFASDPSVLNLAPLVAHVHLGMIGEGRHG
jgi:hypothetical protein